MNQFADGIVSELKTLITDLGKGGGMVSPSVYDTAQVIRYLDIYDQQAIDWLLCEQKVDGGWGLAHAPYSRVVPTVAALLALHGFGGRYKTEINQGLSFMQEQAELWNDLQLDKLTVGLELILPKLIEEANAVGLKIDPLPYAELNALGQKKLALLKHIPPNRGGAPLYSWEAWGNTVEATFVDPVGGIGNNPAATAVWLSKASGSDHLLRERHQCYGMLINSANATGLGLANVYPSFWPLNGFEMAYGLFAVVSSGLAYMDELAFIVHCQAETLCLMLGEQQGIGFGAKFTPDADDTAAALAVLAYLGLKADPAYLKPFEREGYYVTYPFELNDSPLTNAHVLHVLSLMGKPTEHLDGYMAYRQGSRGHWLSDKWHSSWIYSTSEAMIALMKTKNDYAARRAAYHLMDNQRKDGGWGQHGSTPAETAYALLALRLMGNDTENAVKCGHHYLRSRYKPYDMPQDQLWISKDIYAPYRLDRIYELCALLATSLAVGEK